MAGTAHHEGIINHEEGVGHVSYPGRGGGAATPFLSLRSVPQLRLPCTRGAAHVELGHNTGHASAGGGGGGCVF
jgi:hypothetical protein